jgi:hypothetical protein
LEVLFGNKEYCEDFMQEVKQIEPEEKPSEDQVSYYEESSTNVFVEICIPLIKHDVYSISDLFSEIHVEDIWHASQESHEDIVACTMHASKETKWELRTSDAILIFSGKIIAEKNCIFEFLSGKYPISKKKSSKMESRIEVMIISK